MTLKTWLRRRCLGAGFVRPPDPAVAPPGADRAEQQARAALRWYPRFWREEHGEELLATILDATDDSGARRLQLRTRLDLRWRGLGQRRRTRPPFPWLMIAAGGRPVAPKYRQWARDCSDSLVPLLGWSPFFTAIVAFELTAIQASSWRSLASWSSLIIFTSCFIGGLIALIGMRAAIGTRFRARDLQRVGLTPDGTWLDTLPGPTGAMPLPPPPTTPLRPHDPPGLGPA